MDGLTHTRRCFRRAQDRSRGPLTFPWSESRGTSKDRKTGRHLYSSTPPPPRPVFPRCALLFLYGRRTLPVAGHSEMRTGSRSLLFLSCSIWYLDSCNDRVDLCGQISFLCVAHRAICHNLGWVGDAIVHEACQSPVGLAGNQPLIFFKYPY